VQVEGEELGHWNGSEPHRQGHGTGGTNCPSRQIEEGEVGHRNEGE